jgi:hypothetical protein
VVHPGSIIQILTFYPFRIAVKKAPYHGSGKMVKILEFFEPYPVSWMEKIKIWGPV